jgi:hypothetical protein
MLGILGSQGDRLPLLLIQLYVFHAQYYAWSVEISPS